ncbi:Uncharacterised protein [Clostridium putrefaciens]|uniref:Uncharacterized protein n=1 Tax=Clostridium putrefaciens TaxID=99675 RepID=A0A381J9W4_9CLOT|nr:hypothetical protein [Clostridium putrefaciens]SUY47162.1 Uncharacterised protein [Clostridium putrefaciens]
MKKKIEKVLVNNYKQEVCRETLLSNLVEIISLKLNNDDLEVLYNSFKAENEDKLI